LDANECRGKVDRTSAPFRVDILAVLTADICQSCQFLHTDAGAGPQIKQRLLPSTHCHVVCLLINKLMPHFSTQISTNMSFGEDQVNIQVLIK
jgi:hypothetical protein